MPSILNATTTNGLVTSADNSGSLQLQTNNGTTAVTIDTSQNVGIGTSSPNSAGVNRALTISGSSNSIVELNAGATRNAYFYSDGTASVLSSVTSTGILRFNTQDTERMRITSDGYVCVGVAGTLNASMIVARTPTGSTGYGFRSDGVNAAGTTWGHFYGTSSTNSVANIIIYGNGNIVNANNSYGSLSDVKLKENIVDATPKLEKLTQVRVVNYNLIGDTQKQLGVVAQELEQIFPSMIEETPDRDEEGNDLGTTTKSVKYSVFVPMLIKAIQELKAELDATKAEVQALKGVA